MNIKKYFLLNLYDESGNEVILSDFFLDALFQKASEEFQKISSVPFGKKIFLSSILPGGLPSIYNIKGQYIDCAIFVYEIMDPVRVHWEMVDNSVINTSDSCFDKDLLLVKLEGLDSFVFQMVCRSELKWMRVFISAFIYTNGKDSLSESFIMALREKLSKDYKQKIGVEIDLNPSKFFLTRYGGGYSYFVPNIKEFHYDGVTNKIYLALNTLDTSTPLSINWKSKSGKTIKPNDNTVDLDDFEAWFDFIDINSIIISYKQEDKLPFRTKRLKYKLELDDINLDVRLIVTLKYSDIELMEKIEKFISKILQDWNSLSESKKYRNGIVHNFYSEEINDIALVYYFDLGSAKPTVLKNILEGLNEFDAIKSVKITSYLE